jgi:hypothetical protein
VIQGIDIVAFLKIGHANPTAGKGNWGVSTIGSVQKQHLGKLGSGQSISGGQICFKSGPCRAETGAGRVTSRIGWRDQFARIGFRATGCDPTTGPARLTRVRST